MLDDDDNLHVLTVGQPDDPEHPVDAPLDYRRYSAERVLDEKKVLLKAKEEQLWGGQIRLDGKGGLDITYVISTGGNADRPAKDELKRIAFKPSKPTKGERSPKLVYLDGEVVKIDSEGKQSTLKGPTKPAEK